MDDDRVARVLPRLVSDIEAELGCAIGIDQHTWDLVARAVGMRGESLRSDSISASMTSVGAIHRHLRAARALPWSLCVGDLDHKSDELRRGAALTLKVALHVYKLLRIGYSRGAVKLGLQLVAKCPWSYTCVGQRARVRDHDDVYTHKYSANTVRARSMCLQDRP